MPRLVRDNEDVLAAGLRWLYETAQPEGAIITHHGATLRGRANRTFHFIPSGHARRAVVVVEVTNVDGRYGPGRYPANPLEPDELHRGVGTWIMYARPAEPGEVG